MRVFIQSSVLFFLSLFCCSIELIASPTERNIQILSGVDLNSDGLDDQTFVQTSSGFSNAPLLASVPGAYAMPFSGSRWIGPTATAGSYFSSNVTTRYKTTFILPDSFTNGKLWLCVNADNYVKVLLNGGQFGIQPQQDVLANFQAPADCFTSSTLKPGLNEIFMDVYNFGGPTGLNYYARATYTADRQVSFLESAPDASVVPNEYLISFSDKVPDVKAYASYLAVLAAGKILDVFDSNTGVKGVAMSLPASNLVLIQQEAGVESVESDEYVAMDTLVKQNTGMDGMGLDRIDQTNLPLNGSYTYSNTGKGITVYVLDTGIDIGHPDFEGRATNGAEFIGSGFGDCNGHGTHVAGIIGSKTYGVAKEVSLVNVRVLNCEGKSTLRSIARGVNWVSDNGRPNSVINMSLGGNAKLSVYSSFMEKAIKKVINNNGKNFTFVVSAGNENKDACKTSPARVPEVITVGASENLAPENNWVQASNGTITGGKGAIVDRLASYTNYGSCVDLFAPGSLIKSTVPNNLYDYKSGTSMAAPMVAGVVARQKQKNPGGDPALVLAFYANKNLFQDSKGSPNLLVYTGFLDVPAPITVTLSGPSAPSIGTPVIFTASVSQPGSYYYRWQEERCVINSGVHTCWTNTTSPTLDLKTYEIRNDMTWNYSNLTVEVTNSSGQIVATTTKFVYGPAI